MVLSSYTSRRRADGIRIKHLNIYLYVNVTFIAAFTQLAFEHSASQAYANINV